MEMLLMALTMSLLGLAVSAVLFSAATRHEREAESTAADLAVAPSGFFAENPPLESPPVSVEVLLLQIERHVRAEKDAAESFRTEPTLEALRVRSSSPLVP